MGILRKTRSVNRAEWRLSALLLFLAVTPMLLVLSSTRANPARYHDLERSTQPCSDCHTLHYSEGGVVPTKTVFSKTESFVQTAEPSGPYAMLLMRATTNGLCLFCHDGSVVEAPDVVADGLEETTQLPILNYYSGSGDEHSAAGYFANSGGAASIYGHDLGVTFSNSGTDKFTTLNNVTLTCASCHDPHGTPNYRNILTAPAGGDGVSVEMARDVYRDPNNPPGDPPSQSASIAAYKESNLGYKTNTSKWCTECHDQLKDHVGGSTPTTRKHHRADVALNDSAFSSSSKPPDYGHWNGGTGKGFGSSTSSTDTANEGVPRLRFQAYSSSSGVGDVGAAQTVNEGNEVMCMSCHLAHGGKYKGGLVWPYADDLNPVPADQSSGCYQCHNEN